MPVGAPPGPGVWELHRVLEVGTCLDQALLVPVEVVGTCQVHLGGQVEEAVLDQRDYG